MTQKHWIFGYGSLICQDSRSRTGSSGEALPVKIEGLERSWNVPLADADLSVVGIRQQSGHRAGGMLFPVEEDQLPLFDAREREYQRVELFPEAIETLDARLLPQGSFWVYLPPEQESPHPIAQSYLDVILHGCLQQGRDFAQDFLATTTAWKQRLDDRQQPLYARPLRPRQQAEWLPEIDSLLEDFFSTRQAGSSDKSPA
ncbi:gamma-glutamylcyclotransferase family protein [Marinospirillum perlucidum]|uniref:gamma-glutamylcyclotransferase family protein n=1 Tax=Marinospirillum perlucidum TaxID=1982602 RepID=UPI000DF35A65|nr:gamma-glutamylcyclotransferase family protein [Marinospirillum perlucidum]